MSIQPEIVRIGSRREVLWDDSLIDRAYSNTETRLHNPVRRECVLTWDDAWGGSDASYTSVLQDGDLIRLYSNVGGFHAGNRAAMERFAGRTCYAESRDGIHWAKPNLDCVAIQGSKENDVLLLDCDGFRVMRDDRIGCPPEQRYKAIADFTREDGKRFHGCDRALFLYYSEDAKRFSRQYALNLYDETTFDSINTLLYNRATGKYECFMRGFYQTNHDEMRRMIRSIMYSQSDDLIAWSDPVHLKYADSYDWQMYLNNVSHYPRAEHVYIGFPARYALRTSGWTTNYDELCGRERRHQCVQNSGGNLDKERPGTSVTEALFMTSRDGLHWTRFADAFMAPGPEHPKGWVYGGMYVCGMAETDTAPDGGREISLYTAEGRWFHEPATIHRYALRLDGFASQRAPFAGAFLRTKKLIFEGETLFVNLSTSAAGCAKIAVTAEDGRSIRSRALSGDGTDLAVEFPDGSLADFAGQPATLEFELRDADLYSFVFQYA